jgi:hypothetical protein
MNDSGKRQPEAQEQRQRSTQNSSPERDKEIPAIRHVGPTLESDPEYNTLAAPGYSTPEAQISAEAGQAEVDQRPMEEDDFDSLSGRTLDSRPERLKTRLPGDTSSDPHSDVGSDNATNLQERRDLPDSRK